MWETWLTAVIMIGSWLQLVKPPYVEKQNTPALLGGGVVVLGD
jgi:hypothetical protein